MAQELVEWMRAHGVVEMDDGTIGVRLKLDPSWSPPKDPEPEPVYDVDPIAHQIAKRAHDAAKADEQRLKDQAAADALTFAHVEGFPE